MRSIELTLFFVLLFMGCNAQKEVSVEELNQIGSPVDTEVELNLASELENDTRFIISFRRVYKYPFKVDTTLLKGEKKLSISLPLEKPVVLRMRIGKNWDHLFVFPGRDIKVNYDTSLSSNSKISVFAEKGNEDLAAINVYYDKRFELLDAEREISQAYQRYNMVVDVVEAIEAYDSLTNIQLGLLESHKANLPEWFENFETKDIEYFSTFFALGNRFFHEGFKSLKDFPDEYKKMVSEVDLNDEFGMLTDIYYPLIEDISFLIHCGKSCNSEDDIRFEFLRTASLEFGKSLKNNKVRQIFFAQVLRSLYTSSYSYPDSLIQAFEHEVGEPYLNDVQKLKNPSLIGQPAGNFYLSDPDGEFHTLKDLEGKVALINFWFVGCKPCEEQIEYEKALVEKLKDKDFVLVNICTNTAEEAWKEYISEKEMPGLNLYAKGNWGSKLSKSYQFSGYPTYVLLDKNNRIVNDKAPRPSSDDLIKQITERL